MKFTDLDLGLKNTVKWFKDIIKFKFYLLLFQNFSYDLKDYIYKNFLPK